MSMTPERLADLLERGREQRERWMALTPEERQAETVERERKMAEERREQRQRLFETGGPDYLRSLGFPRENLNPEWQRVPNHYRAAHDYAKDLRQHLTDRTGLSLCSLVGAGKTSVLALLALRAWHLDIDTRYFLAGYKLVEALHEGDDCRHTRLVICDDLDFISGDGYEGEARSWDAIGRWLYERCAYGGPVLLAANITFDELCKKPGMDRVASRFAVRIPEQWRLTTNAPDQRAQARS